MGTDGGGTGSEQVLNATGQGWKDAGGGGDLFGMICNNGSGWGEDVRRRDRFANFGGMLCDC